MLERNDLNVGDCRNFTIFSECASILSDKPLLSGGVDSAAAVGVRDHSSPKLRRARPRTHGRHWGADPRHSSHRLGVREARLHGLEWLRRTHPDRPERRQSTKVAMKFKN